jgi:hypothetical protein
VIYVLGAARSFKAKSLCHALLLGKILLRLLLLYKLINLLLLLLLLPHR